MARIIGDTADLPAGWHVDADNWGTRRVNGNDAKRIDEDNIMTACIVDGMVCVMDAETAAALDA